MVISVEVQINAIPNFTTCCLFQNSLPLASHLHFGSSKFFTTCCLYWKCTLMESDNFFHTFSKYPFKYKMIKGFFNSQLLVVTFLTQSFNVTDGLNVSSSLGKIVWFNEWIDQHVALCAQDFGLFSIIWPHWQICL